MMALADLQSHIAELLGSRQLGSEIALNELCLQVERGSIASVLTTLRDNEKCRFTQLLDICGVDYPERAERFDVVYHLLSMPLNQRVRVKITAAENAPVPSVVSLYPAANWFEREAYDLFGILFDGHPDLRRLLTDYGFEGYPLRKDFPLSGYVEVRYDTNLKRVVYEPVKLPQDFRSFDNLSPWEGMTGIMLPGDEKAVNPFTKAGAPK
jgi:NADH-quinone oxidoreductase subunit C